jgi:hypothetical protein
VPAADATYDTTANLDPLQLFLTSCTVNVPIQVETELRTTAQYTDIHAALTGPRLVPAPRLVCEYARNEHITAAGARQLLSVMG